MCLKSIKGSTKLQINNMLKKRNLTTLRSQLCVCRSEWDDQVVLSGDT